MVIAHPCELPFFIFSTAFFAWLGETIYGKLKFSNLGRFGNLKVLMLQDKNTLQKRSVSHIVVKIASLSWWKVLIVIMEWIVIYLPKRTFQEETGRFANALGQFAIRQQIKMNATRFMVTNNRLPKSTIKAETVEKKKYLNPFLRNFSFVWIISVWIFCWLCNCLTHKLLLLQPWTQ